MEANREREKNILMEANREREKNILKGSGHSLPSPSHSADGTDYNISEVILMLICTYGINIYFFFTSYLLMGQIWAFTSYFFFPCNFLRWPN